MESMIRTTDFYPYRMITMRLNTIALLLLGLFSTITFEFILSAHPKLTLFEHIQLSLTFKIWIDIIVIGSILFVLLTGFFMLTCDRGVFVIYITLLKFFQLIPPLIDLINLLFIYHYRTCYANDKNSYTADIAVTKTTNLSTRFGLSLIFALIRLVINLDFIRRQCDCRWKSQIIRIFDLLLFILVNISLIRYLNINLFRIGRKIILGLLIFQLNGLFYNETFWIGLIEWNKHIQRRFHSTFLIELLNSIFNRMKSEVESFLLKIIHLILLIRWIISSMLVCLFVFYIFQSIIITGNDSLFFNISIPIFFKSHGPITMFCLIILHVIRWDTVQNRNALDQYGISRFCIGIDLLSRTKLTKSLSHSTHTVPKNVKSPSISIKEKQQTCLICYDDKDLEEFSSLFANTCRHSNRSICNSCLFLHVQRTFQITFTDDIYCPEPECHVKFDYDVVKHILSLNDDHKLVERYDQYILHRPLEQMNEFIWCSNPKCNFGQLNEGSVFNNIVTCFNCHQKTCFTHRVKWHEGLTCEEYDMGIDQDYESSRRWIVENSKKCPNCPYQIEKNDGCDHMKCIKCKYEFCWSCLADFQPIRHDGNHRHYPTCKHYASYDGE